MKKNLGIIKLAALLLLFPFLVWELSLKKTYTLGRENRQLEEQVAAIGIARSHSSKPVVPVTTSLLSNGQLLEMLTDTLKANRVEIVSFQPELVNEEAEYKLYAGTMVLRGGYINLVKVIDAIEKMKLPIKVSSVGFALRPSKERGKSAVELTLVFQQIEN